MEKPFTASLKNFNFWLILTLFTATFVIHSCKKEFFSSAEAPSAIMLEKAKTFYNQQTTTLPKVSSASQGGLGKSTYNNEIEEKKAPIWTAAKMEKTKDGRTLMTVPLKKYNLDNKDIGYARKYVFEERNGEIANGKIIEVIGGSDFIEKEGESAGTKIRR